MGVFEDPAQRLIFNLRSIQMIDFKTVCYTIAVAGLVWACIFPFLAITRLIVGG